MANRNQIVMQHRKLQKMQRDNDSSSTDGRLYAIIQTLEWVLGMSDTPPSELIEKTDRDDRDDDPVTPAKGGGGDAGEAQA